MRSVRGGGSSEISPRVKFDGWPAGSHQPDQPTHVMAAHFFRTKPHFDETTLYCLSRVASRSLPSACPRSRSCTLRAGRPVSVPVQFGLIGCGLRAPDGQGRFGLLAPHHWNSGRADESHIIWFPSFSGGSAPHGGGGRVAHCLQLMLCTTFQWSVATTPD